MKTIVRANSIVSSVIGGQAVKDTEYRPMKYTFQVKVEDGLLLHNVITGQLVLLTEEEKRALDSMPMRADVELKDLISGYYLVPVGFDEYGFVRGYRKILQMSEKNVVKPITKYTILPTTYCNAHCFYCYESDYRKISMDEDTARKVVDFILEHARGKRVSISWFGGEPTVGMDRIDYISKALSKHGVDYVSGMVSNGYLFSEKVVKKAVDDWKLRNIQITLDGTEEVYNRTKDFKVEGSAYQRVLCNIGLLLEAGVKVTVLFNLDEHNQQDLYVLADELAERFREYSNFRIATHVLFEDKGYEKVHHTYEQQEELAKSNYRLADYMRSIGLNANVMGGVFVKGKLPKLRYLYCMVNNSAAIVIGPNGSFYKCEHVEKDLVSSAGVGTGLFKASVTDDWFEADEEPRCKNCCLYPDCFVPVKCEDHRRCYSVDAENRLTGYKEIAKTLYQNITQREKSAVGNSENT